MKIDRKGVYVALALAAAFGHRAYFALEESPIVVERSSTYTQPALELLHQGTYSGPETFRRPPTYPFFLAGIFRVSGENMRAVVAVQHALGFIFVCFLTAIAIRLWGTGAGFWAALYAGFYHRFVYYEANIQSESLFLFLTAATLLLLISAIDDQKSDVPWRLSAGGLLAGLAGLCRPEFALFGFIGVLLLLTADRRLSGNDRARRAAFFFAPYALLVGGFVLRNAAVFHSMTISPLGAVTSLEISEPWIDWRGPRNQEAKQAFRRGIESGVKKSHCQLAIDVLLADGVDFTQAEEMVAALGRETLLRHPFRYAAVAARAIPNNLRFVGGGGEDILASRRESSAIPAILLKLHRVLENLLLPLAILGYLATARRAPWAVIVLGATVAYLAIVNGIATSGEERRTLELEPLLILFAAAALWKAQEKVRAGLSHLNLRAIGAILST